MKFRVDKAVRQLSNSILVYKPDEFSFDFEPGENRWFTSVLIDDVSLEVDESGKIRAVWGLCPHSRWIKTKLSPPDAELRDVYVLPDEPFSSGVSVRLNRKRYLPVYVDSASGWVHIPGEQTPTSSISPLRDVILELTDQDEFGSLWLKPERLPPL
jgi:hypothetical protein